MSEPHTEAGKALLRSLHAAAPTYVPLAKDAAAIVAIEDEAATEAHAEAIQEQLDDISDIVAVKVTEARRELPDADILRQAHWNVVQSDGPGTWEAVAAEYRRLIEEAPRG